MKYKHFKQALLFKVDSLLEVKTVLANYFRKKADECLDSLWDSGVLNQAKLDELRHQDLHA